MKSRQKIICCLSDLLRPRRSGLFLSLADEERSLAAVPLAEVFPDGIVLARAPVSIQRLQSKRLIRATNDRAVGSIRAEYGSALTRILQKKCDAPPTPSSSRAQSLRSTRSRRSSSRAA